MMQIKYKYPFKQIYILFLTSGTTDDKLSLGFGETIAEDSRYPFADLMG